MLGEIILYEIMKEESSIPHIVKEGDLAEFFSQFERGEKHDITIKKMQLSHWQYMCLNKDYIYKVKEGSK